MVPPAAALVASLALFAGLSGAGLVSGCNKSSASVGSGAASSASATAAEGKLYDARGVIKGFTDGKKAVKIAHEDIPGYMKAMTMAFAVSSANVLDGFKDGDAVDFSFVEASDGRLLIQTLKKRSQ